MVFFRGNKFRSEVDLRHCRFAQGLKLCGSTFLKSLKLDNTVVGGRLYVFLTNSERKDFLREARFPSNGVCDLFGFTYDQSDLAESDRWRTWIKLCPSDERYAPDPYLALERSFRRGGREDLADQVHFEMRRAERQAIKKQRLWSKWILYGFWEWSVGYGVRGLRLLIWAALVIVSSSLGLSWLYFHSTSVSPIWTYFPKSLFYTLCLFLPIDFKLPELEQVAFNPKSFFILLKFLTKVAGWIIVPLAVAQIGGFLKKKE